MMVEAVKTQKDSKMALEIKNTQDESKSTTKKTSKISNNRVHLILDESSSMSSCWDSTISGFNEYVDGLRNDKAGNKYKISLSKFNGSQIIEVFKDVPIKKVEPLTKETYRPSGMTNLNDAIGFTMTAMELNKPKRKHNTLIIIMTDGYENASREWTANSVASLVKKQEKKGWTITFLGANIDTQSVSRTYAIKEGNTKSYSTSNMAGTMRGLVGATTMYASTASANCSMDSFYVGTGDWEEAKVDHDQSSDDATMRKFNVTGNIPTFDNMGISGVPNTLHIDNSLLEDEVLLKAAEKALKKAEKDEDNG